MPPKDWKTREQLAILSQVHTNTVSTWLNENKEKNKENLEYFKLNVANKEKNKWFINPEEFYKSYPKRVSYEREETIKEPSSVPPPSDSFNNFTNEQTTLDREEGKGALVSSKDLKIAHNVRDAFGKIGYVIEPKKPFYSRVAFWLIIIIIALLGLFIFAYVEHKKTIIVQRKQIAESYKTLILSKEEQYNIKINAIETHCKEKLLYQAQLNKKDLELNLKDVELVKSELAKSKLLTQQQNNQLAETKKELSKLQEEFKIIKPEESSISSTK